MTETFEREYEALRLENERNVQELHKTFKDNIEKSRPPGASKQPSSSTTLSDEANFPDQTAYLPLQQLQQ